MFETIIIFILLLAALVLVHEFGHFIVGKLSGMKIEEFGFGFPPRVVGIQKVNGKFKFIFGHPKNVDQDHTVYSINLIPLGGFVRILGENGGEEKEGSFSSKKFWPRFLTLFAGVAMNVVFAWFLISLTLVHGVPVGLQSKSEIPRGGELVGNVETLIVGVQQDSPGDQAGLKPEDTILTIDGKALSEPTEIKEYIQANKGKEFIFTIERQGEGEKLITVDSTAEEGKPSVGITMALTGVLQISGINAFTSGVEFTWFQLKNIGTGLYDVFTSSEAVKSLGGPVKIAQITGQVAETGFINLMQFAAFLSLNLGVLNILPIPALDGGRILFLLIETVRRKKNNAQIEQIVNTVGFLVLLLLMFVVTIKDLSGVSFISKLFS